MIYTGHAGYLDDHLATVRKIAERLKGHSRKYDVIVATGLSGVLVASPLSIRLRKPLVVIRKPNENCHSFSPYVNAPALEGARYLFVDDFISLGDTYDRVRRLCEMEPYSGTYAGTYLYQDDLLSWDGDGLIVYTPDNGRRRNADVTAPMKRFDATDLSIDTLAPLTPRSMRLDFKFEPLIPELPRFGGLQSKKAA